MRNLRQIASTCLLSLFITASATALSAKANGNGIQSLGQMPCQEIGKADYDTLNEDVPVGYEIFRAVSNLSVGYNSDRVISSRYSGAIVCRLAGAGERPSYRTLNLAFGISDDSRYSETSMVRLSVYLDGNFYQYQDVRRGQKYLWPIDVSGTRSVALEPECIRGERRSSGYTNCSNLFFFEDSLE